MSCNKVVFFVRPVETLKIITRDGEGLEIDTSVGRNPKLRPPLVSIIAALLLHHRRSSTQRRNEARMILSYFGPS